MLVRSSWSRLYDVVSSRFPKLASWLHLPIFFCSLILLDLGFRWFCRFAQVVGLVNTLKLMPFTLGWALLLTGIAALLPGLAKKIYMSVIAVCASALYIVHGVFINMFRKFFSFSDIVYAGDGAAFADTSYFMIRKLLLLFILFCLVIMLLAVFLAPPGKKAAPKSGAALLLAGLAVILVTRFAILGKSEAIIWDQNTDPAFLYEDFSDSRACLTMLGLYQYTFRDLQMLLPQSTELTEAEAAELASYANSRTHSTNEMTGLFAGKNLLLVQLESIDTWMLDYMPALSAVKEKSIVFANHYTPAYITAGTFNTEFMANTGLLPAASGTPISVYTHNNFSNSLANLFREKGYSANSFHGSEGNIYNREAIHLNLGYEKYYGGSAMGMPSYVMDSQMMLAFDKMVTDDPFFSFIITYSGHGPYGDNNVIFKAHEQEARAAAKRTDGRYVYAVGHAMETDLFVKELMSQLEASGHLDDTVVIFFADHYNYYMLDDNLNMDIKGVNNLNLLQHTDCFIYSADTEAQTVEKYTSTLDILPTLANLFDLDADYSLMTGDDAFSPQGGYVFFNDNSTVGGSGDLTAEVSLRRRMNTLLLNSDYWGSR